MYKNFARTRDKIKYYWKKFHITALLIIISIYLLSVTILWIVLKATGNEVDYFDVLLFNALTIAGNDYPFVENVWTRIIGILFLAFSLIGLSLITGYASSAFIAKRMSQEREIKKMQNMKKHIIICGYQNDIENLIFDILRKNKKLKTCDIVVINNSDEKINLLKDDPNLKGLNLLKGDYTVEQTLLNANIKEASKVLIIGERFENLDDELIDSRVFVTALMVRNLNPKCYISAIVKTLRYKNYLEAQNCAEVIYTEEYTRYILSTSTSYSGMSKVMSSFLDNGDGTSVQIVPIEEKWYGKKYIELFNYYKKEKNILVIGILENMGIERELKHQILSEAQKSTNYGEIVQKLKNVKSLETNTPKLNPNDDYILDKNMGAIILGEE